MKILFVFHHAGLTGAALLLYSTVEWLNKNTDIKMSFLLRDSGILKTELAKFGEVYEWETKTNKVPDLFSRVKNKLFGYTSPQEILINDLERLNFDIIYFNTILCSSIINKMADFQSKKIWHIHELELAIQTYGVNHLKAKDTIETVLANSSSTRDNLIKHDFKEEKIRVLYPFIDLNRIRTQASEFSARSVLNIPDDVFVIGSSGAVADSKGVQSFLTLPILINHLFPENNFYFLWVGTFANKQKALVEYDIERFPWKHRVIFAGEQHNPFPFYKSFDVFVSTSKEESFGLSAIESASLNKPIICFKNTGGVEEIAVNAENITINYMDVYQMAVTIIDLYNDSSKRALLGNKANQLSQYHDINVIMPKMYEFLKESLNKQ